MQYPFAWLFKLPFGVISDNGLWTRIRLLSCKILKTEGLKGFRFCIGRFAKGEGSRGSLRREKDLRFRLGVILRFHWQCDCDFARILRISCSVYILE
ncbi:hypothetical protein VNO80_15062 [Phaseolus coccineus]|uniref:Uncharacterized protein n=1 Tax=Phaseolus coccineus TaxID=3886 RepID=A0AAN9MJ60_PHACN